MKTSQLLKYVTIIFFFASLVSLALYAGRCGCGARVRSSSHASSSYRSPGYRPVYHSSAGTNTSTSPDPIGGGLALGIVGALLGWAVLWVLRTMRGLFTKRSPQCTHRLEDHILSWPERILFLVLGTGFVYFFAPTKGLAFFKEWSFFFCVLAAVCWWWIDSCMADSD